MKNKVVYIGENQSCWARETTFRGFADRAAPASLVEAENSNIEGGRAKNGKEVVVRCLG